MRVLGIEFAASQATYVLLMQAEDGQIVVSGSNRISLSDTRSCEALRTFQMAVQTLLNDTVPDLIAIKEKPEKGSMRAGAAALKMEGIVLANARCSAKFISGARINKCSASAQDLNNYYQPAYKAAFVALSLD
jgi:hypothetical protein